MRVVHSGVRTRPHERRGLDNLWKPRRVYLQFRLRSLLHTSRLDVGTDFRLSPFTMSIGLPFRDYLLYKPPDYLAGVENGNRTRTFGLEGRHANR